MGTKIYVVGHLNIDHVVSEKDLLSPGAANELQPVIGGTAFNAAKAFKARDFEPIIIGKVGNDHEAYLIKEAIKKTRIEFIIKEEKSRPTGCCRVVFSEKDDSCRYYKSVSDDANQFDLDFLKDALKGLSKTDLVFLAGHFLTHSNINQSKEFIDTVSQKAARFILDVVPHNIYQKINLSQFNEVVRDKADVIIGEFTTMMKLGDPSFIPRPPAGNDWKVLFAKYQTKGLVIRYGLANISKQQVLKRRMDDDFEILEPEMDTGFAKLNPDQRRGFGDVLTADFISRFINVLD
jgi:sugar/nucleoside kinase (ribokinase family)